MAALLIVLSCATIPCVIHGVYLLQYGNPVDPFDYAGTIVDMAYLFSMAATSMVVFGVCAMWVSKGQRPKKAWIVVASISLAVQLVYAVCVLPMILAVADPSLRSSEVGQVST